MSTPSTNLPVVIGGKQFQFADDVKKVLLTRTVSGWSTEEVATLGESDVFVVKNPDGNLRLVKAVLHLTEAKGEITRAIHGKQSISVQGYNTLNRIAGLHRIKPETIMVDGQPRENPYPDRDTKTGRILGWRCRIMAVGYSPLGNLVIVDVTMYYDFNAYLLQDIESKSDKNPGAIRFGTKFSCPLAVNAKIEVVEGETIARDAEKVFLFKAVDSVGGFWIDMSANVVADIYATHIQQVKHGAAMVQSITWRNAQKQHPAIATTQLVVTNASANVLVYGYKSELTRSQLEEVGKQVAGGAAVVGAQVTQVTGEASYEEVADESEAIVATEEAEGVKASDAPQPQEEKPKDPNLKAKIESLAKEKGVPDLEAFCRNSMGKPFAELSPEQLTKLSLILEKASAANKGGVK